MLWEIIDKDCDMGKKFIDDIGDDVFLTHDASHDVFIAHDTSCVAFLTHNVACNTSASLYVHARSPVIMKQEYVYDRTYYHIYNDIYFEAKQFAYKINTFENPSNQKINKKIDVRHLTDAKHLVNRDNIQNEKNKILNQKAENDIFKKETIFEKQFLYIDTKKEQNKLFNSSNSSASACTSISALNKSTSDKTTLSTTSSKSNNSINCKIGEKCISNNVIICDHNTDKCYNPSKHKIISKNYEIYDPKKHKIVDLYAEKNKNENNNNKNDSNKNDDSTSENSEYKNCFFEDIKKCYRKKESENKADGDKVNQENNNNKDYEDNKENGEKSSKDNKENNKENSNKHDDGHNYQNCFNDNCESGYQNCFNQREHDEIPSYEISEGDLILSCTLSFIVGIGTTLYSLIY